MTEAIGIQNLLLENLRVPCVLGGFHFSSNGFAAGTSLWHRIMA
jgi:hypothetical protein